MTETHGFWGPPTSSVDWCEPNYNWSFYIAGVISFFLSFFLLLNLHLLFAWYWAIERLSDWAIEWMNGMMEWWNDWWTVTWEGKQLGGIDIEHLRLVFSSNILEFWNTLSNIPPLILGIMGILYATAAKPRFNIFVVRRCDNDCKSHNWMFDCWTIVEACNHFGSLFATWSSCLYSLVLYGFMPLSAILVVFLSCFTHPSSDITLSVHRSCSLIKSSR